MNNKNIQKRAKNFLKLLKGNTDFVNAEKFLKESGYKVIFYNTKVGDAELARSSDLLQKQIPLLTAEIAK